jgi:hypothetical protein
MRRTCGLLAAALCLLPFSTAGQSGTFEAVTTGFVAAKLAGQSSVRISPAGETLILLSTATPSPLAIVIIRESGDLPAVETSFPLVSESCDNDPPSSGDVERTGGFSVTVRGGPPSAPEWAASAHRGTLTVWRSAAGIAGRFDFAACGEHVKSGDRVELTLSGTFQSQAPK